MKNLPTDVSTFSTMIDENYVYVDKTDLIYSLFNGGTRYYFLSRPRRFGKTLLISTLKELFLGNKKLFSGLKISQINYKWDTFPVIHLDFTTIPHKNTTELLDSLNWRLTQIAQFYNVNIDAAPSVETKFAELITQLSKKNKVVILIDEYDKPLLDHISNLSQAEAQRIILRSFYDVLKGLDPYLRAIFITGVTKFSKTSIFSGINNLNDISLKPEASILLGYTEKEIKSNFNEYLEVIALHENQSLKDVFLNLTNWYNGYAFSEKEEKIYNPFSVLYYLKDKKLRNYWFESGTPSFLINLIKNQYYSLEELKHIEVSQQGLGAFELNAIPLVPLLFQTGYLTIKNYNNVTDKFILGYPNFEVEESFTKYLVSVMAGTNPHIVDTTISKIIKALKNNKIEDFCVTLQTLFAQIPYTIQNNKQVYIEKESYYHAFLQFLMSLLHIEIKLESASEILTNQGRIDLVTATEQYIYIFELKVNSDPSIALQQIRDNKYYEKYMLKEKKIILVGLAFNFENDTNSLRIECLSENL